MIKNIQRASRFKRDFKSYKRKHFNMALLKKILVLIIQGNQSKLSRHYHDHALHGNWQGYRELHVDNRNDILLVYEIIDDSYLGLARLNTHNKIFG